jgi:DNA/RNA endonuclease YhcR with UshA esterase domain
MGEKETREERPFGPQSGLEPPTKPIDQADLSEESTIREFPEETLCPSCGRFVGAYEKCPYCGAELKKRMSLIVWKRIAVFGAVAGLLLMWLAATRMAPKLLDVAEITETYNNAIIQARGIIVERKLTEDRGMVKLLLADKTGKITALSFSGLAKFRELGNLPRVGDQVELLGQVSISDQYGPSLFINLPSKVKILESPSPEEASISKINDSWVNSRVTVKAGVKSPPRFGKAIITDGASDLILILDESNLGKDIPSLQLGAGVKVTGVITGSGRKLMITPGSLEDIELTEAAVFEVPRMKIGEITLEDMDQAVEIEGRTSGFFAFKNGGGSVTISDGSGSISVPIFSSNYDQISGADRLRLKGTRIRVRGKVGEYRGKPQVQPASADSVTILSPE